MIRLTVRHYIATSLILSTALGILSNTKTTAQTFQETQEIQSDWSFWPTDDDKAPKRTVSGATRGNCSNEQVTALLPSSQYGLTRKSHPEILVATSADGPSQALFSVQSADDYYYETYVDLPEAIGIVSIALPLEAPPLMENSLYQWSLILMCNHRLRPDSPSLQGWIQTQPTDTASPNLTLEQAALYRDEHLWYDMIALLAELQVQYPENSTIHQAWHSILTSIDLAAVIDAPILP
ncbi:MAG: DUF928 domain-containing protein [Cyanobacteria bacterium P01_C01_bin.118]